MVNAHASADPQLIERRFGQQPSDPQLAFGFSCVGRYSQSPQRGCDWTLGGFLQIHRLLIVDTDGAEYPAFEPATPDEAQARWKAHQADHSDGSAT